MVVLTTIKPVITQKKMDVQGLIALFLCFPVGLALIMLAGLADLPLEDECPKVCPAPQQRPLMARVWNVKRFLD